MVLILNSQYNETFPCNFPFKKGFYTGTFYVFCKDEAPDRLGLGNALVGKTYIVNPERIAHAAYVSTPMARVELEYDVGGRFVCGSPSNFFHGHHFAL